MTSEIENAAQEKIWNKPYILILLISTFIAFSFYMTVTLLSKYLVGIGVPMALAGFIVGLFSLTSLFSRPFCGLMADRLDNRKLIFWSNVVLSVGIIGFAVNTNTTLIIFFRILSGLGFAIGSTVQVSLAVKFIPKGRMGEGIGYMGVSQLIGSACAPAVGIAIADTAGIKMTFFAAAALAFSACLFLIPLNEANQQTEPTKKKGMIRFSDILEPRALPFTFPYTAFSFVNGMIASYLVLFAENQRIEKASIYFTVYALVLFAIRPLAGKLMDRKGLRYTVFPGIILTILSLLVLSQSRSLAMLLVSGILRAIGQGSAQPSLQAECINQIGKEKSGVASSTFFLGGDIGQGVAPMVGGALIANFAGISGYTMSFYVSAGLLVIAFLSFFFIYQRVIKKAPARTL